MSTKRTIRYILRNKCSVARFGDGELDQIIRPKNIWFQEYSPELSSALEGVLHNKNKGLLKCVPRYINSVLGVKHDTKDFWLNWGNNGHHETVISLLRKSCGRYYLFGDTQMSRPYIDYVSRNKSKKVFDLLKKIWINKDILIVEGNETKLGVGNDLFDGVKSIKRIIVPPVNAFDCYDSIFASIQKNAKNRLILMAVGPTATVLASDLCNAGLQAIDIGHIDIEYEWYLRKASSKIAIDGKFTNEAIGGASRGSECKDEQYVNQIIDRIGC